MSHGTHEQAAKALVEFLEVMEKLRDPKSGCPWDLKQTFESLPRHVVEEAYEIGDAVHEGAPKVCEELGDLLSLIGLFSQIARESGQFSFETVARGITDKLIRRHPHVFGDVQVSGTQEVLENWESIKLKERAAEPGEIKKGLLDGLPRAMPGLLRAHEIGERCARVGFDWRSLRSSSQRPPAPHRARQQMRPPKSASRRSSAISSSRWRNTAGTSASTPKRPSQWPTPSSSPASRWLRTWPPPSSQEESSKLSPRTSSRPCGCGLKRLSANTHSGLCRGFGCSRADPNRLLGTLSL